MAAIQLSDADARGTSLGQSSTDKVSLYNATPVVQAAAITAPAATGASNSTPYGFTTSAQADALVTAVRAIIVALQNVGITA